MNHTIHRPAKRNTVKKVIQAKLNDWMETLPDDIADIVRKDTIVTGGSIVSLLLGEKINDFDIYFGSLETTKVVAEYYCKEFAHAEVRVEEEVNIRGETETRVINYISSSGVIDRGHMKTETDLAVEAALGTEVDSSDIEKEEEKYRVSFISKNAITLTNSLQIVTRFYGHPEQIHDSFDFVHAMCYYCSKTRELVLPAEALESMMSRSLVYKGSLYPIASIFRMKKFVERGWRIGAGEMMKIMWQISELDLLDTPTLIDQCTGADLMYLDMFVSAIINAKDSGVEISGGYITEILDRIFNE